MKKIKYQLCTEIMPDAEDSGGAVQEFLVKVLPFSEANEEIAKVEAYNGAYTIHEDSEPEPVIPPSNDELAAENKLLREQVSALTDQNDFQEELIVELANIVYA